MLNRIAHGDGALKPLVIVHGLYGSARNWGVIARRLSDSRHVVALDMRNHGDSFHDPDHSYPALADDIAAVIRELGDPVDLLGHSMGGKAAMVLARTAPELIDRLIVVDIAPVTYAHTQMPYIEAMRAVDLARVDRRSEAEAQLAGKVEDPTLRSFLLQSLDLSGPSPRWKLNLDALGDQMPLIMGFPEVGGVYDGRMAVIRGESSDYVTGDHADALRTMFPTARLMTLKGAGHWLHAENPRGFEEVVRAVLAS